MNAWFVVAALVIGLLAGWYAHTFIVALGSQDLAARGQLFYRDEAGRWYPKDPRE